MTYFDYVKREKLINGGSYRVGEYAGHQRSSCENLSRSTEKTARIFVVFYRRNFVKTVVLLVYSSTVVP